MTSEFGEPQSLISVRGADTDVSGRFLEHGVKANQAAVTPRSTNKGRFSTLIIPFVKTDFFTLSAQCCCAAQQPGGSAKKLTGPFWVRADGTKCT